jgi:hypothetical protein
MPMEWVARLRDSEDPRELIARLIAFKESAIGVDQKLLAAFHKDLPVSELEPLLRHENPSVLMTAGWILSELGRKGAALLAISEELLTHPEEEIRDYAITNILANSDSCSPETSFAVLARYELESPFIRGRIINYMARARLSLLRDAISVPNGAIAERHASGLRMHSSSMEREDISNALNSADGLIRAYAIAAIRRLDLLLHHSLRLASRSEDAVVRGCASRWMKKRADSPAG